jgi:hypothetical protein
MRILLEGNKLLVEVGEGSTAVTAKIAITKGSTYVEKRMFAPTFYVFSDRTMLVSYPLPDAND